MLRLHVLRPELPQPALQMPSSAKILLLGVLRDPLHDVRHCQIDQVPHSAGRRFLNRRVSSEGLPERLADPGPPPPFDVIIGAVTEVHAPRQMLVVLPRPIHDSILNCGSRLIGFTPWVARTSSHKTTSDPSLRRRAGIPK